MVQRENNPNLHVLADAATDGLADWIVDEDIYYASPRFLEQWGLPAELTITKRLQMVGLFPFHPDDRAQVVELLDQHRSSDAARLEFDARVIRRGEVRWMHCTILYFRDAAGWADEVLTKPLRDTALAMSLARLLDGA